MFQTKIKFFFSTKCYICKILKIIFMLNRRLIRIKVFKVLFSAVSSGSYSASSAEKELIHSCEKSRDLYYFILNMALALRREAELKIEIGLKKFCPTPEEANPNLKFVNNRALEILAADKSFTSFCQNNALTWGGEDLNFIKTLLLKIQASQYYYDYMHSSISSLEEDCTLLMQIFEEELEDNEELLYILEEKSLYWIDDLNFVLNIILKSVERIQKRQKAKHPDVFLKEDDEQFARQLLNNTMVKYDSLFKLVSESVPNWDMDRLVSTDIILIIMGLTEAMSFPEIPLKVTINEYVEISKYYSTPNSRVFVNGLLDKLIQRLMDEGSVVKQGRGLIDS